MSTIDNERHRRALENVGKVFGRSGGRGGDVLKNAAQDLNAQDDIRYLLDQDSHQIETQLQELKKNALYKHKDRSIRRMHDPMPIRGILENLNQELQEDE